MFDEPRIDHAVATGCALRPALDALKTSVVTTRARARTRLAPRATTVLTSAFLRLGALAALATSLAIELAFSFSVMSALLATASALVCMRWIRRDARIFFRALASAIFLIGPVRSVTAGERGLTHER